MGAPGDARRPLSGLIRTAIGLGVACVVAQGLVMANWQPLRGDFGLLLVAAVGLGWLALSMFAVIRYRRQGLWAFAPAPLVLALPILAAVLFATVDCSHMRCD